MHIWNAENTTLKFIFPKEFFLERCWTLNYSMRFIVKSVRPGARTLNLFSMGLSWKVSARPYNLKLHKYICAKENFRRYGIFPTALFLEKCNITLSSVFGKSITCVTVSSKEVRNTFSGLKPRPYRNLKLVLIRYLCCYCLMWFSLCYLYYVCTSLC